MQCKLQFYLLIWGSFKHHSSHLGCVHTTLVFLSILLALIESWNTNVLSQFRFASDNHSRALGRYGREESISIVCNLVGQRRKIIFPSEMSPQGVVFGSLQIYEDKLYFFPDWWMLWRGGFCNVISRQADFLLPLARYNDLMTTLQAPAAWQSSPLGWWGSPDLTSTHRLL